MVALLTDDAWFTMPPITLEYQGHEAIAAFLRDITTWRGSRHYRLIPTRANGQPAFGCYLQEAQAPVFRAHGMIVLTLEGDRISAITRFVDNSNMARFGLPRMLANWPGRTVLDIRVIRTVRPGLAVRFLALGPSVMTGPWRRAEEFRLW